MLCPEVNPVPDAIDRGRRRAAVDHLPVRGAGELQRVIARDPGRAVRHRAQVDGRIAGVGRRDRRAEHAVALGNAHEGVHAGMHVGQRLRVADADLPRRLVALVDDAGRALRERPGRGRGAGEQVLAIGVLAVGHVHEGREILPHLVGDHLALVLAERGVPAGQRRVARALQHRGHVRQRLLFVAEAALE